MIFIIKLLLIILAVLLFGCIIFIHEFGHFFTAKMSGVKVNEFAIGMGPKLFQFQKGETKYSLRLFPIGGYCQMEGEDEESDDEGSFSKKPVYKRIIIVAAGALMNIILGLLFMVIILGQEEYYASNIVYKFADNAVSSNYGLQVGDKIVSINGYKIMTDKDLSFALSTDKDYTVDMVVNRDNNLVHLDNVKFGTRQLEDGTQVLALDFYVEPIKRTFPSLISQSFKSTVSMVRMVFASLVGLVTGQFGFNELAGPVGAASAIGEAASAGLEVNIVQAINNILTMMVIITVNLGIVNLLPLPALDGGRLVFLFIEAIRGKPIDPKYEGWVHAIGLAILLAFMAIVTVSDILRLATGKGLG